ncbi:hypothetical protein ATANTOWER_029857 [Ataeniobius toweri]|uniref:Uncharacterized protein n=1 Tax=Ataeniobius toweri TaxID=208326 RepID=A0ABU7B0A0_9TELE|nr:hypothetical protein [Ataeniobius toweri]
MRCTSLTRSNNDQQASSFSFCTPSQLPSLYPRSPAVFHSQLAQREMKLKLTARLIQLCTATVSFSKKGPCLTTQIKTLQTESYLKQLGVVEQSTALLLLVTVISARLSG